MSSGSPARLSAASSSAVPSANSSGTPNFLFKYSTDSFHFHFSWGQNSSFPSFIHSHCPNSPLALRTETAAGFLYLKCILGTQKTPTIGEKVHFYVPFLFKIVVQ